MSKVFPAVQSGCFESYMLYTVKNPAPTSAHKMEIFLCRSGRMLDSDAQEGFGRPTKTDPHL